MPEARDRLSREEDLIADFSIRRRTASIRNIGRGDSPIIFVLEDEVDDRVTAATPFRWRNTPMTGTPGPPIRATIGTPRIGRGTSHFRTPARIAGRENSVAARGRGRGGSVLPSWYPRRPLQDITSVLRAIERRRARGEEVEGRQLESPILQDRIVRNPSVPSVSDARLEHDISMISPSLTIRVSRCPPSIEKVNKILLSIANQKDGDPDSTTPQKKLLNNIDTVEKVVMEELRKLKRTPSAKKAEREKRVRTLMSMR